MKQNDRLESRPPREQDNDSRSFSGSQAGAIVGATALVIIAGALDPFEAERCWQDGGLVHAVGRWRRQRIGGVIRSQRVKRSWPLRRVEVIRWAA
jgi:hypothetical protein